MKQCRHAALNYTAPVCGLKIHKDTIQNRDQPLFEKHNNESLYLWARINGG